MDVTDGATSGTELVTDASPAPESGQAEVTDAAPEVHYFDPTEYASHVVKVKVDGEDLEVPVSEALQGYQRQADYTRKTQSLAEQQREVEFWRTVDAAAKVDPNTVLGLLAQRYGIQGQPAVQQPEPVGDEGDWNYDDPTERKLAELYQLVQPVVQYTTQQQAEQFLNQVVSGLQARYDDFDAKAVIAEAVSRGHTDPSVLESVYKEMAFDRMRAQTAAQQQHAAQRAAEEAARQAAAAAAAALVSSGGSASGEGGVTAPATTAPSGRLTVRDAYEMAKAKLAAS